MRAAAVFAHGEAAAVTLGGLLDDGYERAPVVLLLAVLLVVAYVRAIGRTPLSGAARRVRLVAWVGGVGIATVALVGPVEAAGGLLASGHMVQHMLLADLAPALCIAALTGGVAARMPGAGAVRAAVRRVRDGRVRAAMLLVPLAWSLTWWTWHAPAAYELALRVPVFHALEHATLLASGIVLWIVLIDPGGRGRIGVTARIGCAVGVLLGGTLLANAMTYVDATWYPAYAGNAEALLGWSSMADQQIAGGLMVGFQVLTLGPLLVVLGRRHLRFGETVASPPVEQGRTAHPLGL